MQLVQARRILILKIYVFVTDEIHFCCHIRFTYWFFASVAITAVIISLPNRILTTLFRRTSRHVVVDHLWNLRRILRYGCITDFTVYVYALRAAAVIAARSNIGMVPWNGFRSDHVHTFSIASPLQARLSVEFFLHTSIYSFVQTVPHTYKHTLSMYTSPSLYHTHTLYYLSLFLSHTHSLCVCPLSLWW